MAKNVIELGRAQYPRRFYGECQRCQRTDYLPWATEHGVRYCGWCHEHDALEYLALHDRIARRAAPSETAYEAVAAWFDDKITTELFLREMATAGFQVVSIAAPPQS